MPRAVSANPKWCSICGLYIPPNIVSSGHPLFGTVDHVVPLSRGGTNGLHNRKPAHRWCNGRKGNAENPLPAETICSIQGAVIGFLKKTGNGQFASEKWLKEARQRIGLNKPTKQERARFSLFGSWQIHRWEDDGGAVLSEVN